MEDRANAACISNHPDRWGSHPCARYSGPVRLIRAFCTSRHRNAGTRHANQASRGNRPLSIRTQPDVCGADINDPWSKYDSRKSKTCPIRRSRLAYLSPVCSRLRGTSSAQDIWGRLQSVLHQCTPVDTASPPMERVCRVAYPSHLYRYAIDPVLQRQTRYPAR